MSSFASGRGSFRHVAAVAVSFAALGACSAPDTDSITRVEGGLSPLVTTEDQLGVKYTIEQRMLHYEIPGVSIAVFNEGEIDWAKAYGVSRPGDQVPVDTSTLFQAASISKSVTALGALRLVQDGILDLDEDVNSQLSSWRVPPNRFTEERNVTLRELLDHTAGVTVRGFPGYRSDETVPTLEEILDGVAPANTQPIETDMPIGDTFRYSGGGYTIIQKLLIDVTGQTFQEYMAKNVLHPLGMTSSTFDIRLDDASASRAAWGYRPGLGPVEGGYHLYPELAAAGLWSTPTDIARFAIGVHRAAVGSPDSMISKDLADEMLTANSGNYGYGFMISGDKSSRRFRHTGINEGFDSMFVAYASSGTGAVVMTNSNLSSGLIDEIVASIAEEYSWPDFPALEQRTTSTFSDEELTRFPGAYLIEEGFEVSVTSESDRLFMLIPQQGRTEIHSDSESGDLFVTGFPFPPFQLVVGETGREIRFPTMDE